MSPTYGDGVQSSAGNHKTGYCPSATAFHGLLTLSVNLSDMFKSSRQQNALYVPLAHQRYKASERLTAQGN